MTSIITPDECVQLFEYIKHSKQDEQSIDKLAKWINTSTTTIIEHAMTTSFMKEANEVISDTVSKQVHNKMTLKIEKYLKQEFDVLHNELNQTAAETQEHILTHIHKVSNDALSEQDKNKDKIDLYLNNIQNNTKSKVDKLKNELDKLRDDFIEQCRDFLEDHTNHRRTVFTNQKAQYDNDRRTIRDDMDRYMARMQATKVTMEEELTKMNVEAQLKTKELQTLTEQL